MKVKVLHEFVAGKGTFLAGTTIDLPADTADRVVAAGWAVAADPEWPKHLGGGTYELSNGEHVKGKKEAVEAQTAIDEAAKT